MDNERLKRHLGIGVTVKLKARDGSEDEFTFVPLTCEYIPEFFDYQLAVEAKNTKEVIRTIVKLCEATVRLSYPAWDDYTVKAFTASNFIRLQEIFKDINDLGIRDNPALERAKAISSDANRTNQDKK